MVSDTSDSILKCKKQNTVIVFLEIPSSKASAHPRHLFAGSLHKCWCGYTWVLLVIFLGMGVNVGVPCVYGIFIPGLFTLTREDVLYWEQGSFQ